MMSCTLLWAYGAMAVAAVLLIIAFGALPWWLRRSAERDELARRQILDHRRGATGTADDCGLDAQHPDVAGASAQHTEASPCR